MLSASEMRGFPKKKKLWTGLLVRPTRDLRSVGGTVIKKGTLCKIDGYYRGASIVEVEKSSEYVPMHRSMSRVNVGALELESTPTNHKSEGV